jgi:hypothetical protein
MITLDLAAIGTDRKHLWDNGYPPLAILKYDDPDQKRRGKAPILPKWPLDARRSPPDAARFDRAHESAPNTGIATHGLRFFDIDCGDPDRADHVHRAITDICGPAPMRYRENSARFGLLYRAADGEPRKRTLPGKTHSDDPENPDKVEVLGNGQQFVAYGLHPSGVELKWHNGSPLETRREQLPVVTEEQVLRALAAVAPIIGAKPPKTGEKRMQGPTNGHAHLPAELARARGVLMTLVPADDYDDWITVGAAVRNETGGSDEGFEVWQDWSAKSDKFPGETVLRGVWDSLERADGPKAGFGKIYHIAGQYGWKPNDETEDPGYQESLEQEAKERLARSGGERSEEHKIDSPTPPPKPGPSPQPGAKPHRAKAQPPASGRILIGDDFVTDFTPPDWLIDGIVQRGRLYACTSLTGHGKTAVWLYIACMVHASRMVGNLDAVGGHVLYIAGENPEDLKARMHGMVGFFGLKSKQLPFVLPAAFPMTDKEANALIKDITALGVPLALIVGDTASSFFPGDDENDNVQAGAYARTLRRLTLEVPGNPTVVALCHPVKNAAKGNLLPRGGGAFLNELDCNLTLWSESQGEVTELHWQGKIRGPDFPPLAFSLRPVPTGYIDRKARPVMTIVAEPMSEEAAADHAKLTLANTDVVLRSLRDHPDWSLARRATEAGWVDEEDRPLRGRVQRALRSLSKDKLIERKRESAPWTLTAKGEEAAKETQP